MNKNVRFMTNTAMIAAVYTVMSMVLAPLAFSQIQIRFAEILCLLPVINSKNIWGITLGCLLTNLIGAMLGINILGYIDVIIGTFATFVGAYLTFRLRYIKFFNLPLLSALMPVIANAVIIGAELSFAFMPNEFLLGWLINGFYVGLGEFIAVVVIGLFFYKMLENRNLLKIFNNYN